MVVTGLSLAKAIIEVTTGLISRRRCFLEQAQWRTAPWALDPSAQSGQSRLVNILVFMPGFLEDHSRLVQEYDFVLHQDLLQSLQFQLKQLFEWRWHWQMEYLCAAWEEENDRDVFPGRAIRFATTSQAAETMIYNTVLIWILGLLWKVDPSNTSSIVLDAARHTQGTLSGRYTRHGPLHLPGEVVNLHDVAVEICRAFDFQIRNTVNNSASILFFLMPIGLAWSVLGHEEEWAKAINESLSKSHVTSGYQTGQNVFGFGSYAVPNVINGQESATLWLSHSEKSVYLVETTELD
ncbi:hypothetical protein MMC27_008874 [Xylographa pallens]|nr:hypothetical protein [Xylographa pallens]